jgi:concentrative nucleoside transporter, CNT family
MRMPETEEPVTRGRVTVDRGESKERAPVSSSHTYIPISI